VRIDTTKRSGIVKGRLKGFDLSDRFANARAELDGLLEGVVHDAEEAHAPN
jgi:hypothetical protein